MGRLKHFLACSTSSDWSSTNRAVRLLRSIRRSVSRSITIANCMEEYSRVEVREPNTFQPVDEYHEEERSCEKVKEEENIDKSLDECDPTTLLDNWLGELDTLKKNLQNREKDYKKTKNFNSKSLDNHSVSRKKHKRCSIIKLDSIEDDEMLAILGDLTVLESQFEQEIQSEREKSAINTDRESLLLSTIDEDEERIKAENIKIAVEKIKEASVKKLFIKVFTSDGSSKSLLVDETMTAAQVAQILAEKNLVTLSPMWALVELAPELYIERVYEDHELLVENCLLWKPDSKNTLWFMERPEKFDLFRRPEEYILTDFTHERNSQMEDYTRQELFEEYFSGTGTSVLKVEGFIWFKLGAKKEWNKLYCVLRPSGLYYSPKNKSSTLECLATFDVNEVYYGVGWKGKYKAPTEFCFAIKHPKIQAKNSKNMKYFCLETEMELHKWVAGIRFAKHGQTLCDNYQDILEDMAHTDIDELLKKRCSINSNDCLKIFTNSNEEDSIALTPVSENKSFDSAIFSGTASDVSVRNLQRKTPGKCETDISLYSSSSSGCLSGHSSLLDVTLAHDDDILSFPHRTDKVDSITSLNLPPPPQMDLFYQEDPIFPMNKDQGFQEYYSCDCTGTEGEKILPQRHFEKTSQIEAPNSSRSRRIRFDETVRVIHDEALSSEKLVFEKEYHVNHGGYANIYHSVRDSLEEEMANEWSFKYMAGPVDDCATYEVIGRRKNTFKTFFEDVWFEETENRESINASKR